MYFEQRKGMVNSQDAEIAQLECQLKIELLQKGKYFMARLDIFVTARKVHRKRQKQKSNPNWKSSKKISRSTENGDAKN